MKYGKQKLTSGSVDQVLDVQQHMVSSAKEYWELDFGTLIVVQITGP